jgi:hypothetical protein
VLVTRSTSRAFPEEDSPSRERFRPPSRRTVRFRVGLLGGLRPTGAPCSAQGGLYDGRPWRASGEQVGRKAAPMALAPVRPGS